MKSFIPHRCLFTTMIIDSRLYSFSDFDIDLNLINIDFPIDTYLGVVCGKGAVPAVGSMEKRVRDQGFARQKTVIMPMVNVNAAAASARE